MNHKFHPTQQNISSEVGNKPFYMVIRLGNYGLQQHDSLPTVRYDDFTEAVEEAKRLAEKHPTHPRGFAVVQPVAVFSATIEINANYLSGNNECFPNTNINFPKQYVKCDPRSEF